jgi:hypothetical protein
MKTMQLRKAFTLLEPGLVVLVTTNDGKWTRPGVIAGILIFLALAIIVWRLDPVLSKAIWRKTAASRAVSHPSVDEIQFGI